MFTTFIQNLWDLSSLLPYAHDTPQLDILELVLASSFPEMDGRACTPYSNARVHILEQIDPSAQSIVIRSGLHLLAEQRAQAKKHFLTCIARGANPSGDAHFGILQAAVSSMICCSASSWGLISNAHPGDWF